MDHNNTHQPKEIDRETLYTYFENGRRPTANDFKDLIYSTINKLDDGISKSFKYGLKLSPEGEESEMANKMESVISLYERIDSMEPLWTFSLVGDKNDKKLCIISGKTKKVVLTLTSEGHIGVLNKAPVDELDVNGKVRMSGRIGSFASGVVRANGSWQDITKSPLEGCTILEVTAIAYGEENKGKYASVHAIASNAYSGKHGRIRCSRDFYSWRWWQRIKLRWIGTPFNYRLQIKTCNDYGNNGKIEYYITELGNSFKYEDESEKQNLTAKINYSEL